MDTVRVPLRRAHLKTMGLPAEDRPPRIASSHQELEEAKKDSFEGAQPWGPLQFWTPGPRSCERIPFRRFKLAPPAPCVVLNDSSPGQPGPPPTLPFLLHPLVQSGTKGQVPFCLSNLTFSCPSGPQGHTRRHGTGKLDPKAHTGRGPRKHWRLLGRNLLPDYPVLEGPR